MEQNKNHILDTDLLRHKDEYLTISRNNETFPKRHTMNMYNVSSLVAFGKKLKAKFKNDTLSKLMKNDDEQKPQKPPLAKIADLKQGDQFTNYNSQSNILKGSVAVADTLSYVAALDMKSFRNVIKEHQKSKFMDYIKELHEYPIFRNMTKRNLSRCHKFIEEVVVK